MAICGEASIWAKIGLCFSIVGLGIFIGGFATNNWMVTKTVLTRIDLSIGLWKMTNCSESGSCYNDNVESSYLTGSFVATQVFECFVLIGSIATFAMMITYVATIKVRTRFMIILTIVICTVTGFFSLIGVIIWLVQLPSLHYVSYSTGLAVFGAVLILVSGYFLLPDYKKMDSFNTKQSKTRPKAPQRELVRTPSPIYYDPPAKKHPADKPPRSSPLLYREPNKVYHSNHYKPRRPPDSPATPTALRIQVLSPPPSYRSMPSFNKNSRRYGTPKYTQRYDAKAR